jgi:hypothetical protein
VIGSQADLATVGAEGGPLGAMFTSEVTWALDGLRAGLAPGTDDAKSATTLLPGETQVVFGVLPTAVSRHNSPALPHAISSVLKSSLAHSTASFVLSFPVYCPLDCVSWVVFAEGNVLVAVFVPSAGYSAAAASAIGSALPVFRLAARVRGFLLEGWGGLIGFWMLGLSAAASLPCVPPCPSTSHCSLAMGLRLTTRHWMPSRSVHCYYDPRLFGGLSCDCFTACPLPGQREVLGGSCGYANVALAHG